MISGTAHRRTRASLALGAFVACVLVAPASAQELDVVANGLSNPRGLAFGPGGKLFVAESGRGGPGACIAAGEGGQSCYGATGAIARVNLGSGAVRRVVTGLPSIAEQTGDVPGADATGPNDVSFRGRTGYFTIGLGSAPAARAQLGRAGRRFAGLYRIKRSGKVRRVADLGTYEANRNPDAGQPTAELDTNPFSVDASGRGRLFVTDAGGNAVLRVSPTGKVQTVAVLPFGQTLAPPFLGLPPGTEIPYQPVPTGIARAQGGAAYVGQLTGFPFPAEAANVHHVDGAGKLTVHASGFTNIVDVAPAPNDGLFVLQITTAGLAGPPSPGKLVHVAADGTQTELVAGLLQHPTGMAVAKNGKRVYVADQGGSPTGGRVVRVAAPG